MTFRAICAARAARLARAGVVVLALVPAVWAGAPPTVSAATLNLTGVTQLSVGLGTVCGRTSSSIVSCWGDGADVQINPDEQRSRSVATGVAGVTAVAQVELGASGACARHNDGTVTCWGNRFVEKAGGSSQAQLADPWSVPNLVDATDVAVGVYASCAVREFGTVRCWGYNESGAAGQPPATKGVPAATDVAGLTNVVDITAGDGHFCALRSDATVRCWGSNSSGQLGVDTGGVASATPVTPALTGVLHVDAGRFHTCAVVQSAANEVVRCWGSNSAKVLGVAAGSSFTVPASPVGSIVDAAEVSAGQSNTCVLRQTGAVMCWGGNGSGQLGNNTTSNSPTEVPTAVQNLANVEEIDVGSSFACARVASNVYCWGSNAAGRLGRGVNSDHQLLPGLSKVGLAEFTPLQPQRLLDTRPFGATVDGQLQQGGLVAAGAVVELPVNGRGGVAVNPKAVSLNVTAVNPGAIGYVTVWPCSETKPLASNLNVVAGVNRANLVVAKVPPSGPKAGKVCLSPSVDMHLLADVSGYFGVLSPYVGLQPARLVDTRPTGMTVDGSAQQGGVLAANTTYYFQITGRGGVPNPVGAAVLNLTAVNPVATGYLTAFPCGAVPNASNLNLSAGQNVANLVVAKLDAGGGICIRSSVSTHLVIDVDGYLPTTSEYEPFTPYRIVDSRPIGVTIDGENQGGGPKSNYSLVNIFRGPISVSRSVVLNVTVVNPAVAGYITVHECYGGAPLASNVNFAAGQTTPNAVVASVGHYDSICVTASTPVDVIVDVAGSYAY